MLGNPGDAGVEIGDGSGPRGGAAGRKTRCCRAIGEAPHNVRAGSRRETNASGAVRSAMKTISTGAQALSHA